MDTAGQGDERTPPGSERPAASVSPSARLWRNGDFSIFLTGQTLSALGDAFAIVALPLLVLQATGSVAQMGLVTAMFGVGQLLTGAFSGLVADRVDRRRLMIACDTLRMLLYALIPLWWAWRGPALWLIYLVALGGSILGMLFNSAFMALVTNMVEGDQITEATGRVQATAAIAAIAGPAMAGLISTRVGPASALAFDALSFAVSAGSLALVRVRPQAPQPGAPYPSAPVDAPAWRVALEETLAGARYLWRQPTLRAITWLTTIEALLVGGGIDLFIFHLKHDLGQGDGAVGLTLGVASVGAVVGGVAAAWLRRRFGFGRVWIGGFAFSGLALALVGLAPTAWLVAALAVGFTLGDTLRAILQIALRQEVTPDHLRGRVSAAFWTIGAGPLAFGAAGATALAGRLGAPTVLLGMGLGCLALAALAPFTPIRRARPEDDMPGGAEGGA